MSRRGSTITSLLKGSEGRIVTYVPVPPDGGWGWVVVAASFLSNLLADGVLYSTGLYVGRLDESLQVSKASVALIGSLFAGVPQISGPVVSALTNRYGFRTITMCGSVITSASLVLASFSGSIELVWLTFGIIGGFGYGMVYVPSIVAVGFYFEKWRALATCIALCGSGFGTFLVPQLVSFMLDNYGWRSALISQAGLFLHCAVCGSLYRPLKPVKIEVVQSENEDPGYATDDDAHLCHTLINKLRVLEEVPTLEESQESLFMASETPKWLRSFFKGDQHTKYATVHGPFVGPSYRPLQTLFRVSNTSLNDPGETIRTKENIEVALSLDKNTINQISRTDFPSKFAIKINNGAVSPRRDTLLEECLKAKMTTSRRERAVSQTDELPKRLETRRATIPALRPYFRDDVFLQGSLNRLPEYTSKDSRLEYTMTVTRVPVLNEDPEFVTSECRWFPRTIWNTLSTSLDFSLLASPTFLLFCLGGFLTCMGTYVPFLYIESRARSGGMDPSLCKWLISTIGVCNIVGRASCGLLSSFPRADALLVNNIAMSVGGVATVLSGLYMTVPYQFFYSVVFGLSNAIFWSLRSIIAVDLFGLENLTNGFGLLLLFQGFAAIVGAPSAGVVMDIAQDENINFILAGGLILLSGVVCFPLKRVSKWEKERISTSKENYQTQTES